MLEHKPGKGEYGKLCNREDCQKPGAFYYNSATRKYYCEECAMKINKVNREELCTLKIWGAD